MLLYAWCRVHTILTRLSNRAFQACCELEEVEAVLICGAILIICVSYIFLFFIVLYILEIKEIKVEKKMSGLF